MSEEHTDCNGDVIPEGMHEYAFDVKLFAVVRVVATDKKSAIKAMEQVIDGMSHDEHWVNGFNAKAAFNAQSLRITEVSLDEDGEDDNRVPFEVDGDIR